MFRRLLAASSSLRFLRAVPVRFCGCDSRVYFCPLETSFYKGHSWLFCWTELGARDVGIIQSLIQAAHADRKKILDQLVGNTRATEKAEQCVARRQSAMRRNLRAYRHTIRRMG